MVTFVVLCMFSSTGRTLLQRLGDGALMHKRLENGGTITRRRAAREATEHAREALGPIWLRIVPTLAEP